MLDRARVLSQVALVTGMTHQGVVVSFTQFKQARHQPRGRGHPLTWFCLTLTFGSFLPRCWRLAGAADAAVNWGCDAEYKPEDIEGETAS